MSPAPVQCPPTVQQSLDPVDPFYGVGISFQEMALSRQVSRRHEDAVDPPFKGAENIDLVELAGTGQADDLDVGQIGQAHHPGQIGRGKGTVVAGKGDDIGLPFGRDLLAAVFPD
jgi:hypothetical protein